MMVGAMPSRCSHHASLAMNIAPLVPYLFLGLVVLLGIAILLEIAIVIRRSVGSTDPPDGHDRAAEREERWYPLR